MLAETQVYLFGASGHHNYGDDLIAQEWVRFYNGTAAAAPFVETFQPTLLSLATAGEGLLCRPTYLLLRACDGCKATSVRSAIESGLKFPDADISDQAIFAMLERLVSGIKLFHVHGGGFLNGLWPHTAFALGALVALKRRQGARLVATGLGLGPLSPDDAAAFAEIFREFDMVEVRDAYSWTALGRSQEVILGSDDTFLIPQVDTAPAGPKRLHLSIFEGEGIDGEDLANQIVDYAATDETLSKVVIYEYAEADRQLRKRLEDRLSVPLTVRDYASLWERGMDTSPGDVGIASRFHAHLLLARRGVRGRYVSSMRGYYDLKHEGLAEIGTGWTFLDRHEPLGFNGLNAPAIDEVRMHAQKRERAAEILALAKIGRG